MRYGKKCISAAKIYRTNKLKSRKYFSHKLKSVWETNFSYTFDRTDVIDMGRQFFLWWDGAPMGMAVTLADRQHSGNDPRRMSLRKIMLSFGAIISTTFIRNGGNTPNGLIPPFVSRSRSRLRRAEVRKAQELHLGGGKQDKGVSNCSR